MSELLWGASNWRSKSAWAWFEYENKLELERYSQIDGANLVAHYLYTFRIIVNISQFESPS